MASPEGVITAPCHCLGGASLPVGAMQAADTSSAAREEELRAEVRQLREANRSQAAMVAALVDSVERRQMEVASNLGTQHLVEQRTARLDHAERLLRSVVEALDGALCIVGDDGTVLDANRRWPTPVGVDFFAWCRDTRQLNPLLPEVAAAVRALIDDPCPDDGDDDPAAVKGRIGSGRSAQWLVMRVHRVRDHQEARAVVTMVDISRSMRTQEQLEQAKEQTQRLALVARATNHAVAITEPDGTIEWVNEPFLTQTGYTFDQVVGRCRTQLLGRATLDLEEFQDFLTRVEGGRGADGEFPMTSRTGRPYWVSIDVQPVVENRLITHLVWIEQDVTSRKDTQQRLYRATHEAEALATALNQEKNLLTGVISAIPQLVYWKDEQGRHAGHNRAYLDTLTQPREGPTTPQDGADHALGTAIRATLDRMETQVVKHGRPLLDQKIDIADDAGRIRSMLLSVLPLELDRQTGPEGTARGVIGVGADVTHVRELERQLAQANRLESIGQLAAGIAHEINTPIQFVSDNTQFIAQSVTEMLTALCRLKEVAAEAAEALPEVPGRVAAAIAGLDLEFLTAELPNALKESREGLGRVTQIVRAMKDYAHPGLTRSDVDVNRAIESTVQISRNEWKYVAEIDLDLDPDAGLVPAYEGELKQVILNMIVNAAHAIGDDPARASGSGLGRIRVRTRRTPTELVITIQDDGPGMTPDVRERAFDPFFTTKDVGKGTGQGLSLAHAVIVTKHQGHIDLATAPGEGATFTLHLPFTPPA